MAIIHVPYYLRPFDTILLLQAYQQPRQRRILHTRRLGHVKIAHEADINTFTGEHYIERNQENLSFNNQTVLIEQYNDPIPALKASRTAYLKVKEKYELKGQKDYLYYREKITNILLGI